MRGQQRTLFRKPVADRSANIVRQSTLHDRVNLEIARSVLANVEMHGGDGAGLVLWASLVVRHADELHLEAQR